MDKDVGEIFSYVFIDDVGGFYFIDSVIGQIMVNGQIGDFIFEMCIGSDNFFNGIDVGGYFSVMFGDFDGDGDMDVIVGNDSGNSDYFENMGIVIDLIYMYVYGFSDLLDGVDIGYDVILIFVDIDGDGDLDVFVGEYGGNINFFENIGISMNLNFVQCMGFSNLFDGVDVGNYLMVIFVDFDGDGDMDVFVGEIDGNINYFENIGISISLILI